MGKVIAWLRRHIGPAQSGHADGLIEASLARYAQAEATLAHFRSGGQCDFATLKRACNDCQVDLYDVLRDHNRAFQSHHHPTTPSLGGVRG